MVQPAAVKAIDGCGLEWSINRCYKRSGSTRRRHAVGAINLRRWCATAPLGERKMKKTLKPYNQKELQRAYPLTNLLEGWFFRCEEISAGHYQVKGMDVCGRTVETTGIDPDELLKRCVADAKAITV